MPVPKPTPIYRIIHFDNLHICLRRRALHAPNFTPKDGLVYRTIHNAEIQASRRRRILSCGPCGSVHDYVAFYFGPRSPMLYQLHTGWVEGYTEGQEPIIYLVSTVQSIAQSGSQFVFSDGHGIASYTTWFDDLKDLSEVDWSTVYADYWKDDMNDMDRQRRKQAEFLVHRSCDRTLIHEIGVFNAAAKRRVENLVSQFAGGLHRPVNIRSRWYY